MTSEKWKILIAVSKNRKIKLYWLPKSDSYSFYVLSWEKYVSSKEYNISQDNMNKLLENPNFQNELNKLDEQNEKENIYNTLFKNLIPEDVSIDLEQIDSDDLFTPHESIYKTMAFKDLFLWYLSGHPEIKKETILKNIKTLDSISFEYITLNTFSGIIKFLFNNLLDKKEYTLSNYFKKSKELSDIIFAINKQGLSNQTNIKDWQQYLIPDYSNLFNFFLWIHKIISYPETIKDIDASKDCWYYDILFSKNVKIKDNAIQIYNHVLKDIFIYKLTIASNRSESIQPWTTLWTNYTKNYNFLQAIEWANIEEWLSWLEDTKNLTTSKIESFLSNIKVTMLLSWLLELFEKMQRITWLFFSNTEFINWVQNYLGYNEQDETFPYKKRINREFITYDVNLKLYNISPEKIKEKINKKILWQEEVVEKIRDKLNSVKLFWKQPWKPLAAMLFAWPTWVWKSEIAKLLAVEVFGKETSLISIPLSQYQGNDAGWLANQLTWSQTWYVWSDKGWDLVNKIDEDPRRVVLFDELDKIDASAMDFFMQLLDEWKLYNNKTWQYSDFSNAIIIFTTNFWADVALNSENDKLTLLEKEKIIRKEIIRKGWMKPEFLNRFKDLIMFNRITETVWMKMLTKILNDKSEFVYKSAGFTFEFTKTFKDKLYKISYTPEDGVRYIKKNVEDVIDNLISKEELGERTEFIFSLDENWNFIII